MPFLFAFTFYVEKKHAELDITSDLSDQIFSARPVYSSVLQQVYLPLVSRDVCEKSYPKQIYSGMICAGFIESGGKDSCLVSRYLLIDSSSKSQD